MSVRARKRTYILIQLNIFHANNVIFIVLFIEVIFFESNFATTEKSISKYNAFSLSIS